MITITVTKQREAAQKLHFSVDVTEIDGTTVHDVELDRSYLERLGGSPEDLIERSFRFLLKREPKEDILKEFNLSVIQKYFPEYENDIMRSK